MFFFFGVSSQRTNSPGFRTKEERDAATLEAGKSRQPFFNGFYKISLRRVPWILMAEDHHSSQKNKFVGWWILSFLPSVLGRCGVAANRLFFEGDMAVSFSEGNGWMELQKFHGVGWSDCSKHVLFQHKELWRHQNQPFWSNYSDLTRPHPKR